VLGGHPNLEAQGAEACLVQLLVFKEYSGAVDFYNEYNLMGQSERFDYYPVRLEARAERSKYSYFLLSVD
jgi:hypothetical protein